MSVRAACSGAAVLAAALLHAQLALAQAPQQPQGVQIAPQAPAPAPMPSKDAPPPKREGFFDALNRWMDKSSADFKASIDESNAKWRELNEKNEKAARDAAAASREALDAFKNLSNARIIEGRQVCEPAAGGSVDCQTAAEVICKAKGFKTGKSADIQTTRKCSARAWLSREPGGCKDETVVVKAACTQ